MTTHHFFQIIRLRFRMFGLRFLPIFLISTLALAQPQSPEEAVEQLDVVAANLSTLTDFAERVDLGRIMVLKRKVSDTQASVKNNGFGHRLTIDDYQEMVLMFRYSEAFLKSISTECSRPVIKAIETEIDKIIKARGFDQSMGSRFVAHFLSQVHNLTVQLQGQSMPGHLESWFKSTLNLQLGKALAEAKAIGDFPSTFEGANQIYALVSGKYSEFNKINSKSPAYDMITELMGLMEFYRELAIGKAKNAQR